MTGAQVASVDKAGEMAAAQVAITAISAIANSGSQKAQIAALQLQGRMSQLTASQQYALADQLNNAKTDTERLAIMNSTLSAIATATAQGSAVILNTSTAQQQANTITTAIIVLGSIVILIGAIYVIKKM